MRMKPRVIKANVNPNLIVNTNLLDFVDFLQSVPSIHAKKYSHDVSNFPGTNLSIVDLTVTIYIPYTEAADVALSRWQR